MRPVAVSSCILSLATTLLLGCSSDDKSSESQGGGAGESVAAGASGRAEGGSSGGGAENAGESEAGQATESGGTASGGIAEGGRAEGGASDAGAAGQPSAGGASSDCRVGDMLSRLGIDHPLLGASMQDSTAQSAPFDARYRYLAGGLFDGTEPCESCASGCTSDGDSCDNQGAGCNWWGCWQWDQDPPGAYVRSLVETAQQDGQIPMITYYLILQASGVDEGSPEVEATQDYAFMTRVFNDYRFMLQQIGDARAFVHLEPDFWGYAMQMNADPAGLPSAVASANPTDCADQENSIAGLGRCFVAMTRTYAPNALVGLHGSGWATGFDALGNSDPELDVEAEARKLASFLVDCGTDQADFIVVDAADRDAGYYESTGRDAWWDSENQTLPNFEQAFRWAKALSEGANQPLMWWQLPVGNMNLANTTDAWNDNRLDYFFDHLEQVVAADAFAILFGAGATGQTTPETDGGHLVARVTDTAASRRPFACP